jgi:hypothetical protein
MGRDLDATEKVALKIGTLATHRIFVQSKNYGKSKTTRAPHEKHYLRHGKNYNNSHVNNQLGEEMGYSGRHSLFKTSMVIAVFVLFFSGIAEVANATLSLADVQTWNWTSTYTYILSVVSGDVDGDGSVEIVTGGYYYDGSRDVAQLCIWDGASLTLENVQTWYWTSHTRIYSVAIGDVDGDAQMELVTGGTYSDGTHVVAQLCIWNGATLAFENVKTWYWTSHTYIDSVAVGDVDGDGSMEIVSGGYYWDGSRYIAQLCVWSGATLASEDIKTWFWTDDTSIDSVAVGDVDGDGSMEIVTGGRYWDGSRDVAQLCVWSGATLASEDIKTWFWTGSTRISSVAVGNVDSDGQMEIITGGYYHDSTRYNAQLCIWSGTTLALENIKTWYWTDDTRISSVAVGNVDSDGQMEIITGGYHNDGSRDVAQLCIWNGATLAFENVKTWYWTSTTQIWSIAVGDVDGDGSVEVVTGGCYFGVGFVAQLCVWSVS